MIEKTLERYEQRSSEMKSIAKAAMLLRTLGAHPPGLSLGQIATRTKLPRATVQRLVTALEAEGFVVPALGTHGVRLGAEFTRLGSGLHEDVDALCRPILERLCEQTGESVDLTFLDGQTAIIIEQVLPQRAHRLSTHKGIPLPLHCTAHGKAHLSQIPPTRRLTYLRERLEKFTPNTITSQMILLEQIKIGLVENIYRDDEEFSQGICGLAVPLAGLSGGNYAVGISIPKDRLEQRQALISTALFECRNAIYKIAGIKSDVG